jgi:hypothetical protein
MKSFIADTSVALSLMAEALKLLDEPQHAEAAGHLRDAINRLLALTSAPRLDAESTSDPD